MEIWLGIFAVMMVILVIAVQIQRRSAAAQHPAAQQTPTPQTITNVPAAPTSESFPMPAPGIAASSGIEQVPDYIHRLMQSQTTATVLMISGLNGQGSLSILRMSSGYIQFQLLADWPETSERHQKARDFFARLNLLPEEDQANGLRLLKFAVTGNETEIAFMVKTTLVQIMDVDRNAGLKFTYEERNL